MIPKMNYLNAEGVSPEIIIKDEVSEMDEEEIKAKLKMEEENLIYDILKTELENADTINFDPTDKQTIEEIKDISHDLVDIAELW